MHKFQLISVKYYNLINKLSILSHQTRLTGQQRPLPRWNLPHKTNRYLLGPALGATRHLRSLPPPSWQINSINGDFSGEPISPHPELIVPFNWPTMMAANCGDNSACLICQWSMAISTWVPFCNVELFGTIQIGPSTVHQSPLRLCTRNWRV